jgi:hypothetical protein
MLLPDPPVAELPEEEDDPEAPSDVLPPDLAVTCWLPEEKLAVLVPPSRPNPLRLPRICGTVRDTNRSAPVVPASRKVFSSRSCTAAVLRMAGPTVPEVSCFAPCSQYQAPAPMSATTKRPQSHFRPGSRGSTGAAGGTSFGSCGAPGWFGPGEGCGLGDALETDIEVS